MKRNADHSLFDKAKQNKNDEFYTLLPDIERELVHYRDHFRGKTVFCNCDDPTTSNFFRYFVQNFQILGLKKVIAACFGKPAGDLFAPFKPGFYYEYSGQENEAPTLADVTYFSGDGDFRSGESVALLRTADVVVTNPPFSLFREFVAQLVEYGKRFLVIGNINAITYKEIFRLIQDNKVWMGVNMGRGISGFRVPDHYDLYGLETHVNEAGEKIVSPNNCMWLTNLDLPSRHEMIPLVRTYSGNEQEYPHFDNCDAINVNRTQNIPKDYDGLMGVPITFLHRFNPEQFKIVRFRKGDDDRDLSIGGKPTYFRILIQKQVPELRAAENSHVESAKMTDCHVLSEIAKKAVAPAIHAASLAILAKMTT